MAGNLIEKKLLDVKKSLSKHVYKHIWIEIKDIFSTTKPNFLKISLFIICNAVPGFLLYVGWKNKDIVRVIVATSNFGTQFYLAIFAVLLSVFAIFQALQAPKFVKLMHETGEHDTMRLDPLYELGLQFLSLTILSVIGYIYSLFLGVLTTEFVREYIVIGAIDVVYPSILFVLGVVFSVSSIVFLFDLISMVYNLWKTLSIYTINNLLDND